ncbi:hypothetical protein LWI28_004794 [Acer negundo]|uniref:Protein BIC1 n=1 Tax=Acer negundo TaxID=4023 RepID=A0AAD5NEA0_ACENE|nr:hypothetical protein LWI28_004794 [Acer negundo]KAK4833253.1 hypothetical protein QYF36_001564 [Acer negundo]
MNNKHPIQQDKTRLTPQLSPLINHPPDQQHCYDSNDEEQKNPSSKPHQQQQQQQHCQSINDNGKTQSSCSDHHEQVVEEGLEEDNGRERLKRHRIEVAGRVWIPDIWGQEDMLKDWIDCSAFDASLVSSNIMSARAALAQNGSTPVTPPTSAGLTIQNSAEFADHQHR